MSDGEGNDAVGFEGDGNRLVERIRANGHENVSGEHASTFEVTTDDWLTPAGDCILAVDADRAPADFDPAFREACRSHGATITATLSVHGADPDEAEPDGTTPAGTELEATIVGSGHPELQLDSDRSAVGRTSDYVDDRTVMVGADAAAGDLDRELVAALSEGVDCTLTLRVDP